MGHRAAEGDQQTNSTILTSMIFIGIDAGVHTGIAIWSSAEMRFLKLQTVGFWKAHDIIQQAVGSHAGQIRIVIEDPGQNRPTFRRGGQKIGVIDRMAQNVGMVKAYTQLMIERFTAWGLPVERVRPERGKLNADVFNEQTGWSQRTSQHARDAAMLVWKKT